MEEMEKVEELKETEQVEVIDSVASKDTNSYRFDEALWLNLRHLGIILSNLAIFVSIISFLIPISTILAFVGTGVAFMLLFGFTIVSTVVTVGVIWMTGTIQKMWAWLSDASEKLDYLNYLLKAWPFFAIAGTLLGFGSAIILQFIKRDRRIGRIVAGYILGVLCLLTCILCFAGVFVNE